jgi:hypothetical protein
MIEAGSFTSRRHSWEFVPQNSVNSFDTDFWRSSNDGMLSVAADQARVRRLRRFCKIEASQKNTAISARFHQYDITDVNAGFFSHLGWNHNLASPMNSSRHKKRVTEAPAYNQES